jgi:hypothetical protein
MSGVRLRCVGIVVSPAVGLLVQFEICVDILNADPEETIRIMDDDPGVKAGVFTYEIHPCRSFPGDSLPE